MEDYGHNKILYIRFFRTFFNQGRNLVILLSCLLVFLSARAPHYVPQVVSREAQIKAVFIFNFTQFIEWPVDAFAEQKSPLVITVLGDKPFSEYLKKVVKGESRNNHPIEVRFVNHPQEIEECHILFIGDSKSNDLEAVINQLHGRDILTVSDIPDFTEKGGVIRFYLEGGKVRIQINLPAARESDYIISSKLLNVANVVE